MNKLAKSTQPNPSPRSSTQQSVKDASRTRSPGGRSPSRKMARLPCKDYLKGTCTTSFCEKWHLPECLFLQVRKWTQIWRKCYYAHRQVSKRSEKNGDKSAVAMLKITRQLGCVFQDMEPPKSSSIMRKSLNKLKPIRCVKFTKAVVRHANIRDQNPSLGMICPGDPHQRNPKSQNLRIGLRKRWNGRSDVPVKQRGGWPKKILKINEKHKTAFFSPPENWCVPSPSTLKPEEREIVVDSGASMHMISKKYFNSVELETVTNQESPITVKTANGEVQTNEEATV